LHEIPPVGYSRVGAYRRDNGAAFRQELAYSRGDMFNSDFRKTGQSGEIKQGIGHFISEFQIMYPVEGRLRRELIIVKA
jgi:hypothetical protein